MNPSNFLKIFLIISIAALVLPIASAATCGDGVLEGAEKCEDVDQDLFIGSMDRSQLYSTDQCTELGAGYVVGTFTCGDYDAPFSESNCLANVGSCSTEYLVCGQFNDESSCTSSSLCEWGSINIAGWGGTLSYTGCKTSMNDFFPFCSDRVYSADCNGEVSSPGENDCYWTGSSCGICNSVYNSGDCLALGGCYWKEDILACLGAWRQEVVAHTINTVSGLNFNLSNGTDVTTTGQTTTQNVTVRNASVSKPIGIIEINFSAASANITLPTIVSATDNITGKAIFHNTSGAYPAEVVDRYLLVPWLGPGFVGYHCPNAASLADVTPACSGKTSGYTTIVNIDGVDYIKMPNQGGGNEGGVPEFSDLGWILAAALGMGGMLMIRKRGL